MVVLTIVTQKNGETVYFDEPIPQVHFMKLISCSRAFRLKMPVVCRFMNDFIMTLEVVREYGTMSFVYIAIIKHFPV